MSSESQHSRPEPNASEQNTRIAGHDHRILVVDDDPQDSQAIATLLDQEKLKFTCLASAQEGLLAIENQEAPFSLIISNQHMPGILGTEFLSRVKEITPDSLRYLITDDSQLDTIIAAVNKGAVQHYISKPWDPAELRRSVLKGLAKYERHLASEKLFTLAKKQNAKLYELNCELVEATKSHEKKKIKLDAQINALKAQLAPSGHRAADAPQKAIDAIVDWVLADGTDPQPRLEALQTQTLTALYRRFSDLALRNGLEMPEVTLAATEGVRQP